MIHPVRELQAAITQLKNVLKRQTPAGKTSESGGRNILNEFIVIINRDIRRDAHK
jgi:hypothetical protein